MRRWSIRPEPGLFSAVYSIVSDPITFGDRHISLPFSGSLVAIKDGVITVLVSFTRQTSNFYRITVTAGLNVTPVYGHSGGVSRSIVITAGDSGACRLTCT